MGFTPSPSHGLQPFGHPGAFWPAPSSPTPPPPPSSYPATLNANRLWLRARDLSGPTVPTWADQSGQGHHGISTAGGSAATTDPSLVVGATPAGGPAVLFGAPGRAAKAVHKFLTFPDLGLGAVGEIWAVVKSPYGTTAPSTDLSPGLWQFGPNAADASLFPYSNGNVYENFGRSLRFNYAVPLNTPLNVWRLYRVRAAAGAWACWFDNRLTNSVGTGVVAWNTAPALGRSLGANGSFDAQFGGHVAELLVRAQESTAAEVAGLCSYFNTEHGLTVPTT